MRRAKVMGLGLIGLVGALSGAVAWLAASPVGSRWAIEQAIAWVPLEIRLEGIEGTIAFGIEVSRIDLVAGTTRVTVRALSIDPDWTRSIFRNAIVFDAARAESLRIDVPESESRVAEPFVLQLPAIPVPMEIAVLTIDRIETNRLAENLWPQISAGVSLHADRWHVTNAELKAPAIAIHGHLEAEPFDRIALAGSITWRWIGDDSQAEQFGDFRGKVHISGDLESLRVDAEITRPFAISGRARVAVLGRVAPELDVEVQAPELRSGEAVLTGVNGELRLVLGAVPDGEVRMSAGQLTFADRRLSALTARASGTLDAYAGEARAELRAEGLPAARLAASFEGSRDAMRRISLDASTDRGAARLEGSLAFAPWQVDVAGTLIDVDPQYWLPQISGAVSGPLTVELSADRLAVDGPSFTGTLNGVPLAMSGSMVRDASSWTVPAFSLQVGDNRLTAAGALGESSVEAHGEFELGAIAQLYPQIAGDAKGEFRIGGTRALPALVLRAQSGRLQASGVSVRDLETALTLEGETLRELNASAAEFELAGFGVESLAMTGGGAAAGFGATLEWRRAEAQSKMAVSGNWSDEGLELTVNAGARLGFADEVVTLDRSVAVAWHAPVVSITPHCWQRRSGGGELCVDAFAWGGSEDVLSGRLVALPIAIAAALLPTLPRLRGTADGHWQLSRRDALWTGGVVLATSDLQFVDGGGAGAETIALPDLRIEASIGPEGVSFASELVEGEQGVLTANLNLDGLEDASALSGELRFDLPDLSRASQFSRQIGSMTGHLRGHVVISGSRAEPRASGRVELVDGTLTWADPRFELHDLVFDLAMSGADRVDVSGSARGAAGTVKVSGQLAQPFSTDRSLELAIVGDSLEVALPEGVLTASSDLRLVWRPGAFDLTGTVTVPKARIEIEEIPASTVQRSDDVIIVDREIEVTKATRLAVNITINLGDDVRFSGFGLETGLRGRLRLTQQRDGAVRLNGSLTLVRGSFGAFGQTLTIERGRLTYSGPADNPQVSVRAVRKIEEEGGTVTAGVNISGSAQAIESTLFSDPAMPESEILSYLVLGRGLGATNEQESDQMTGAAIGLGLKGAAPLIDEIRSAFGLEELTASGSNTEELAVVAGKRISERVFVRYTYQTFTRMSALLIRLALTSRLSLEATASEIPAMDLLYHVGGDG